MDCPPSYSQPTHHHTPTYPTGTTILHHNKWYTCLVGPYCNAPSFLGYSPPGEGTQWTLAWERVDPLRNDCVFDSTNDYENEDHDEDGVGSVIGGTVWFDFNGDGLRNDPANSLSRNDFNSAGQERGAGISNLKVMLRHCHGDMVGVTTTNPTGEGGVKMLNAEYLQESGGLVGGGIGEFRFRVLPNQIPGEFEVVLESPVGYRLSGGSGLEWGVEEALEDWVLPMKEKVGHGDSMDGLLGGRGGTDREVVMELNDYGNESLDGNESGHTSDQVTTTTSTPYQGELPQITNFIDSYDATLSLPVLHSGYFSHSRCLSIPNHSTSFLHIDAGMAISSWPIVPFQYGSFVLTVHFYGRRLEMSLECREYKKQTSEGVLLEDVWGCDSPLKESPEFEELTVDQGDVIVDCMTEFLEGKVDFSVRIVGLTHVKMQVEEMRSSHNPAEKNLSTPEIARLELGFRVRGELDASRDLTSVMMEAIDLDTTGLMNVFKSSVALPEYMKMAGGISTRPTWNMAKIAKGNTVDGLDSAHATGESGVMSTGEIVGVVCGTVVFISFIVAFVAHRLKRRRNHDGAESSSDSSDSESNSDEDSLSSRWYSDYEGSDVDDDERRDTFDTHASYSERMGSAKRPPRTPPSAAGSRRSESLSSSRCSTRSATSSTMSGRSAPSTSSSGNSRSSRADQRFGRSRASGSSDASSRGHSRHGGSGTPSYRSGSRTSSASGVTSFRLSERSRSRGSIMSSSTRSGGAYSRKTDLS